MPLKKKVNKLNGRDQNLTMVRRGSAPMSCLTPQAGCILAARLKLGNILGEGEFGSVFKGTYQLDDETTVWGYSVSDCLIFIPFA